MQKTMERSMANVRRGTVVGLWLDSQDSVREGGGAVVGPCSQGSVREGG